MWEDTLFISLRLLSESIKKTFLSRLEKWLEKAILAKSSKTYRKKFKKYSKRRKSNLIINQIKVGNIKVNANIFNHHLFDRLVGEIAIVDIIKLSFDKNITHYNFYVHKTHADSRERYHMNGLGIDGKAISYLITGLNSFFT